MSSPEPSAPSAPTPWSWLWDTALVLLVGGLTIAANLAWMRSYAFPPSGDFGMHLVEAASFEATLRETANPLKALLLAWTWPSPYPAAVYVVTFPFTGLLGPGVEAALVSQSVFVLVLMAGLYGLARSMAGRPAAVATMLAALGISPLLEQMRQYLLDFPLASALALSLCSMAWTDGFRHRTRTLAMGLCLGLSMLVKFTFVWFLFPALALAVLAQFPRWYRSWPHMRVQLAVTACAILGFVTLMRVAPGLTPDLLYRGELFPRESAAILLGVAIVCGAWWRAARLAGRDGEPDASLVNVIHAGVVAALVSSPWFLCNQTLVGSRWSPVQGDFPQPLSNFRPWMQELAFGAPGWPFVALLLLGLVLAFWKGARNAERWSAASILFGTTCTFLVLGNTLRYLAPAFAVAPVVAVGALRRVPAGGWIALVLAAAAAFSNLCLPAFGPPVQRGPQPFPTLAAWTNRRPDAPQARNTVYQVAWRLAPTLVGRSVARVALPMDPYQPALADDAWYALQSWSDWHGRVLLPYLLNQEGRVQELNSYAVPRMIQTFRRTEPELVTLLQEPGPPGQALGQGSWTLVVEVRGTGSPRFAQAEVERLLGGRAAAQEHPGEGFTIRVWRKVR